MTDSKGIYNTAPWTAQEDAELTAMRQAGVPWVQVSDVLGRGKDACQKRMINITPLMRGVDLNDGAAGSQRLREKMLAVYAIDAMRTGGTIERSMLGLLYGRQAAARFEQAA